MFIYRTYNAFNNVAWIILCRLIAICNSLLKWKECLCVILRCVGNMELNYYGVKSKQYNVFVLFINNKKYFLC